MGVAGGTLVATAADGRRYTLTVPPGALASATEITATPVVSMGSAPLAAGLKGAVRFGPSGLQFALEATLRIEGATPLRAGLRHVGFSRSEDGQVMRLSQPDTARGVLEVPVFHFSDIGVAEATVTEVANVLPASPSQVVFERMHEIIVRERTETDAEAEAVLSLIFAQIVKPALDAGTASSESAVREKGLEAFESWIRAFVWLSVAPNTATVNARLALDLTSARQQAAGLLKSLFEADIAFCVRDPQNLGFEFAMGLRQKAVELQLARVEFGLAPADTLRRVNDCVRLVIEPVVFPATVTVGTPRSLDASAKLIFATAPQNLAEASSEFTVTSTDASVATPTGLSDALGRYTVVVTPRTATPGFTLRACYVLDPLLRRPGGLTDLCTTQTVVGAPSSVVLQGTVTASVLITATLRGNRTRLESFEGLLPVFDTTSEAVDVILSYNVSMPVPAGTVVQPGASTFLPGSAVSNVAGSGGASVNSLLQATTGSCEITRRGTGSTEVTLANPQAPGGALELTSDGQLGITMGGLRGTYVTTSEGSRALTRSAGCSTPGTFASPFGRQPVASEFMSLNDARATTALPDRGTTTGASSTVTGSAFGQSSLCSLFLREHLRLLEPRLLSSEHITSCTQQTTLSWQLQRE
jgi:hypothetical protein